jgi:hypothetical protein
VAVRGLRDDLKVRLAVEEPAQSGADDGEASDQDPRHEGIGISSSPRSARRLEGPTPVANLDAAAG